MLKLLAISWLWMSAWLLIWFLEGWIEEILFPPSDDSKSDDLKR